MEWTGEVSAGDWLRDRVDDPWRGTMHDMVPRGFAAYARVFHPAHRERPVDAPWPPLPYGRHRTEWAAFQRENPDIDVERVTWAEAAAAFGTSMHAGAQWSALVDRFREVPGEDGPRDAAGWRYAAPQEGRPDADVVAAIAGALQPHTSTPDDAYVAVWEGWGGLVGATSYGPSRAAVALSEAPADVTHWEFLAHAVRDPFNDVFRKPTWQPGVLPDDVSRGPRLELPNRDHVLFRGAVAELADPDWQHRVPWHDRERAATGFPDAESPSVVWPADRAWVVVSEIDWDSTIVAGSREAIGSICADARLEALELHEGADLQADSDEVNR